MVLPVSPWHSDTLFKYDPLMWLWMHQYPPSVVNIKIDAPLPSIYLYTYIIIYTQYSRSSLHVWICLAFLPSTRSACSFSNDSSSFFLVGAWTSPVVWKPPTPTREFYRTLLVSSETWKQITKARHISWKLNHLFLEHIPLSENKGII